MVRLRFATRDKLDLYGVRPWEATSFFIFRKVTSRHVLGDSQNLKPSYFFMGTWGLKEMVRNCWLYTGRMKVMLVEHHKM